MANQEDGEAGAVNAGKVPSAHVNEIIIHAALLQPRDVQGCMTVMAMALCHVAIANDMDLDDLLEGVREAHKLANNAKVLRIPPGYTLS